MQSVKCDQARDKPDVDFSVHSISLEFINCNYNISLQSSGHVTMQHMVCSINHTQEACEELCCTCSMEQL